MYAPFVQAVVGKLLTIVFALAAFRGPCSTLVLPDMTEFMCADQDDLARGEQADVRAG